MNILRGDVARLQRCTAITTSSEEMISRWDLSLCFVFYKQVTNGSGIQLAISNLMLSIRITVAAT